MAINLTLSDTIRATARILCILLLVYAHTQPFTLGAPVTLVSQEGAIFFLRLLQGHTSLPYESSAIVDSLSTKPRATHHWRTPIEVFAQALASSQKPSFSVH